jgi:hypothetical protein
MKIRTSPHFFIVGTALYLFTQFNAAIIFGNPVVFIAGEQHVRSLWPMLQQPLLCVRNPFQKKLPARFVTVSKRCNLVLKTETVNTSGFVS